ncbi:hypothetical protein ACFSJS_11895 [Streptomyces desertarenae]|uniref:Uncharacterized protein n=1 Tax=Streptomyces desertarenae TaxID=2666184 RepID=A0ABW4PK94_9ACTN
MEAHERQPGDGTGAGSEQQPPKAPDAARGAVPMRDLLASCAAADAVSTPPASASPSDTAGRAGSDEGPDAGAEAA